jgi:hypothetical protein
MVKKVISVLLCSFFLLAFTFQAALAENNVSDIKVEVVLYDDGSAYITQTWNCNFSEGTEAYIPIENLGDMSISNVLVSDINGPYTLVQDWNIKAGFAEKAGKYGLVKTDKGYELCWGISEYGERRYAIEYIINQLVGAYTDYDGFNFQFINPGMGTLPTDVTVDITTQDGIKLNAENAGIWAFGFDGEINFEESSVFAFTHTPLSSPTDSVIIMQQLNKGLLHPTRLVDKSFAAVKQQAFQGSDYGTGTGGSAAAMAEPDASSGPAQPLEEEGGPYDAVIGFAVFALLILAIIYFVGRNKRRLKKKKRTLYKNAEYFREAPLAGNLEAAFVLAKDFGQTDDDGNLVGAAFLKLINAGCLEPLNEKSVGLFGREKESVSLRLMHPPKYPGITAKLLYDVLIRASGSDQILQQRELEKYCKKNPTALLGIIEAAEQDGSDTLIEINSYDDSKKAKPLGLSPRGESLLMSIMGFKKYLLEFSLIGERSIAESIIWQDYLTFATLFGIANKAIEQFKKVYPEVTAYRVNAESYYLLAHSYTQASYHVALAEQQARSSGGGGSSSFGGGGGFSGGGSGGGIR